MVNGVIDDVTSDKTFLEYYEYEGKTAFRILEDTLMDALTPVAEPYAYNGTVAWTSYTVPKIAQVHNKYCGVAATQMALIGSGFLANTANNISKNKQWEIANKWGLNGNSANISINITPYMNENYSKNDTCKYRAKCFTVNSYNKITYYLSDALRSNAVPIMMIPDTSFFEYYEGYSYSHYMVVKKVDSINKIITVVDPFHLDGNDSLTKWKNDTFFGEHTITYDELYDVLRKKKDPNSEDLWLSVYSYDTQDPYNYIY